MISVAIPDLSSAMTLAQAVEWGAGRDDVQKYLAKKEILAVPVFLSTDPFMRRPLELFQTGQLLIYGRAPKNFATFAGPFPLDLLKERIFRFDFWRNLIETTEPPIFRLSDVKIILASNVSHGTPEPPELQRFLEGKIATLSRREQEAARMCLRVAPPDGLKLGLKTTYGEIIVLMEKEPKLPSGRSVQKISLSTLRRALEALDEFKNEWWSGNGASY